MTLRELLDYWFVQAALLLVLLYFARRILRIEFVEAIKTLVREFGELIRIRPTIGAANALAILAVLVAGIAILMISEVREVLMVVLAPAKVDEFERATNPFWLLVATFLVAAISVMSVSRHGR